MEDFQGKSLRPAFACSQNTQVSARYGRTIYAVEIEPNLRAVFYIEHNVVVTVDIGTYDLYR